jgi:hypothetical protein
VAAAVGFSSQGCGEVGEAALALAVGQEAGMQVVGVEDGQAPDLAPGRSERQAEEEVES